MLESVQFPGQLVGVLPNGQAKAADHTGTAEHNRFTPIVKGGYRQSTVMYTTL